MRYLAVTMRKDAISGRRGNGRRARAAAVWLAVVLLAAAPVGPLRAADGPEPLPAPVRQAFVDHKRAVLALEADLRDAPDTALTGLPGFGVLLLACDGAGCVGPHRVRITGADTGPDLDEALPAVFAAGGWLPVAVAGAPGTPVHVAWRLGEQEREADVPFPAPGRAVVVVSGAEGLVVRPAVAPGSAETLHAALAEQARGDRLAAVAVLAAGARLSAETPAAQRLLLAGLYREAGLLDEADAAYTALAAGSDAAVRLKAEAGLAAVALDRGEPQAAVDRLTRLAPPPGDPVSVTVNDLLIRAYLATGQGLQATRLLPAEERDPFVAVNRATAFMAIGDTFSAVSELKAAARAASRSVPEEAYLRERILLALGTLYGEQGRLDEALSAFAGMSPRGPLADRMRFGRGLAFHHHGDRVKAIAEFQGLERDAPDSPYALEGMLIMADAYRELNAPRRAVAEYRKALERFQERARAAGFLKDETERMPFDQGLTGLIFSGAWREPAAARDTARYRGLAVLFRTPGFAALFDDYRQVVLTVARLEGVNARLQGRGQTAAAGSVTAAVDRMGVFRSLIEAAARRAVLRILQEERERMEDASLTASLGITQSILFDRLGEDGRELYFREGS